MAISMGCREWRRRRQSKFRPCRALRMHCLVVRHEKQWCGASLLGRPNSGVVRHCWDGAFGAAHRHLRSSQPCGGDRRVLSSLQKKEVYATAIWHDGLAFGDGTGRYHVQQTEAGDVADQRAVARACVVENSHFCPTEAWACGAPSVTRGGPSPTSPMHR